MLNNVFNQRSMRSVEICKGVFSWRETEKATRSFNSTAGHADIKRLKIRTRNDVFYFRNNYRYNFNLNASHNAISTYSTH